MQIYNFDSYKAFLKALMKTFPKNGRGISRRVAEHLNLPPTVISQILMHDRHFTPDQAIEVATFFGLDDRATDYFLNLVNLERADTKKLKIHYQRRLDLLRVDAQNLQNLVQGRDELSDADKGKYYSNWFYSGIWNLTAIDGYQTVDAIADYFGMSRAKVGEVVAFLLESGLAVERDGGIRPALKSTHLNDKSPYVNSHRKNWRDKARERLTEPEENEIFLSIPVSMSESDAERFRSEILKLVKAFSKLVEPSPEETLRCLNIDWFTY